MSYPLTDYFKLDMNIRYIFFYFSSLQHLLFCSHSLFIGCLLYFSSLFLSLILWSLYSSFFGIVPPPPHYSHQLSQMESFHFVLQSQSIHNSSKCECLTQDNEQWTICALRERKKKWSFNWISKHNNNTNEWNTFIKKKKMTTKIIIMAVCRNHFCDSNRSNYRYRSDPI